MRPTCLLFQKTVFHKNHFQTIFAILNREEHTKVMLIVDETLSDFCECLQKMEKQYEDLQNLLQKIARFQHSLFIIQFIFSTHSKNLRPDADARTNWRPSFWMFKPANSASPPKAEIPPRKSSLFFCTGTGDTSGVSKGILTATT